MTQLPISTERGPLDRAQQVDQPGDHERLEAVCLFVDAAVERLDHLWLTSTDLRDGPRGVDTFQARQLLHRAVAALDSRGA